MGPSTIATRTPDGPDDQPADDETRDDLALFVRIRRGDPEAFDTLVHRHTPTLLRLAQSITGSLDSAEDVVQNVFMRLWLRRADLDVHTNVQRYLWAAIRNESRQYVRHLHVEDRFLAASLDIAKESPRTATNPALADLAAEELVAEVLRIVTDLPARCREIFLLAWRDGFTVDEIAAFFEISPRTAQNQVARAIRHLLDRLRR